LIAYIFFKDNISNGNVSDVLVKHYMLSFNTKAIVGVMGVRAARAKMWDWWDEWAIVGGMGRLRGLGLVRQVGQVGVVKGNRVFGNEVMTFFLFFC